MPATPDPHRDGSFHRCGNPCNLPAGSSSLLAPVLDREPPHTDAVTRASVQDIADGALLVRLHADNYFEEQRGNRHPGIESQRTKPWTVEDGNMKHGCIIGVPAGWMARNRANEPTLHTILTIERSFGPRWHTGTPCKSSERTHASEDPYKSWVQSTNHDSSNSTRDREPSERTHASHDLHEWRILAPRHDGMDLVDRRETSERSHPSWFLHNRSVTRSARSSRVGWCLTISLMMVVSLSPAHADEPGAGKAGPRPSRPIARGANPPRPTSSRRRSGRSWPRSARSATAPTRRKAG